MASSALVIGVNAYADPKIPDLRGAVSDALEMREWLCEAGGAGVPEENVALLLSPADQRGANAVEATTDNIIQATWDLVERSGGEGERFYFYFSGHGLSAWINNSEENALVAADFTDVLTTNSCSLRSLREFFETTQFHDQFFFVDACRNIPWEGRDFEIGKWTRPRPRNPGKPPVQQFSLYATSPGLKARELREAGNERGAFTEVLLAGIRGEGQAKAWDPETEAYKVRWDRLVDYVKKEMERRRIDVSDAVARDVFQTPWKSETGGVAGRDLNPTVVEFPPETKFPEVKLEVFLEPDDVASKAKVAVIDTDLVEPVAAQEKFPGLFASFDLPPKTYAVRAMAPEYETARARPPVELYEPQRIAMPLSPAAGAEVALSPDATAAAKNAPGRLVVHSSDPLAALEVADASGGVLRVGEGQIELSDLRPGFYRARLRVPEGGVIERLVELAPAEVERIQLEAPRPPSTRPVQDLIDVGKVEVRADNTVEIDEAAGPVAGARLGTILTLAAAPAAAFPGAAVEHARQLGLQASVPREAESALYVLAAVTAESRDEASEYLSRLAVRAWPLGEPVPEEARPPAPSSSVAGLGELAAAAGARPHWLSLERPGEKPIVYVLALLSKRLTFLLLELQPDGHVRAFQYLPSLEAPPDPQLLRRLEQIQRVSIGGRLDLGYETAVELASSRWADPVAGCLAGYLLLRMGRAGELEVPAPDLTRHFAELADSHVLLAEYEAARGAADAAEQAYRKAVEVGVPITGEGVTRLLDGLGEYWIDHPHARILTHVHERYLHGSLWAAWTPEALVPGELLIP